MIGQVKNVFFSSLLTIASCLAAQAQTAKEKWVDSVFLTLGQNEKLGQLFIARVSAHSDPQIVRSVEKSAEAGDVGGIIFTTGSIGKQARITNALQGQAKIPLLVSQDASSGLGTLLDSAVAFPLPVEQAALSDDSLIYSIAREIGRQMKVMGIQMSLSPNATPFGTESTNANMVYGDDAERVAHRSMLHMMGLQDAGVLSCAKYFPLKSIEVLDQKANSHLTLYHDTLVSAPYRHLFKHGLNAVMPDVASLVDYYELKKSDLKKKVTDNTFQQFEAGDLLHQPLGYAGVVMVDVQSLERASDKFQPGDAALFAFQAGADLIITNDDPDPALKKIKKLIRTDRKYSALLDERVKKMLALKYDAGLFKTTPVDLTFLYSQLHTNETHVLRSRALKESITVAKNSDNILPVVSLEDRNFTCLIAGDSNRADIFYRSI
ncbi:MAG TPA: glycoside hydrolase family 3 N-terminal domain-containing protein, partial [Chryseosolibacter sp.]